MREPNHICQSCGEAYWACNTCDHINSWRACCDTPECYQVLVLFLQWRDEHHNAGTFANEVNRIGFDADKLIPSMRKVYDEGMAMPAIHMEAEEQEEDEEEDSASPLQGIWHGKKKKR